MDSISEDMSDYLEDLKSEPKKWKLTHNVLVRTYQRLGNYETVITQQERANLLKNEPAPDKSLQNEIEKELANINHLLMVLDSKNRELKNLNQEFLNSINEELEVAKDVVFSSV